MQMSRADFTRGMRAYYAGFPPPEDLKPIFRDMLLNIKKGELVDLLDEDNKVIGAINLVDDDIYETIY